MNKSKKDKAVVEEKELDTIDEASKESFPTSDAPAWTLGSNEEAYDAEKSEINELTHQLAYEHHVIKKSVDVIIKLIHAIQNEQRVDLETFKSLISLLQKYVELGHQHKEELLYPELDHGDGHPSDYLVNDLKAEHDTGNSLLNELMNTIEKYDRDKRAAKDEFIKLLKEVHNLEHNHVAKEDAYIVPAINKLIDKDQQKVLMDKFEKIDQRLDPDTSEKLLDLVDKLTRTFH